MCVYVSVDHVPLPQAAEKDKIVCPLKNFVHNDSL